MYRDYDMTLKVAPELPPEAFLGAVGGAYIAQTVRWLYLVVEQHRCLPTIAIFDYLVDEFLKKKINNPDHQSWKTGLGEMRHDLFHSPDIDSGFVRDTFSRFIRTEKIKQHLIEFKKTIDSGVDFDASDVARKIESASSFDTTQKLAIDATQDVVRTIDLLTSGDVRGEVFSTGFAALDTILSGGIARKELLLFEAPPNTGKTTLMSIFGAQQVLAGRFVVHITLEQAYRQIVGKYVSCMTGIDAKDFKNHKDEISKRLRFMGGAIGSKMVVAEFPMGSLSVQQLRSFLMETSLKANRKIDVVVLDYPDLMKMPEGSKLHEQLNTLFIAIRGMAQDMDFSLIAATQTNREGAKKEKVTIADLGECFQKAAHSDVILAICVTESEYKSGMLRLFVAKNRVGEKYKEVPFAVDFSKVSMRETGAASSIPQRNERSYPAPTNQTSFGGGYFPEF